MHYSDYFEINPNFRAVIDASVINDPKRPEEWLSYFPHERFVAILQKILEKMDKGDKSVWIYGPYGTGKTHTALVLRKLFMPNEDKHVACYLEQHEARIPQMTIAKLNEWRKNKVLPVFTSGAEQCKNDPTLVLVRMQVAITTACKELGYNIPIVGNAQELLDAVKGHNEVEFWKKRDEIQNSLNHLTCDIKTFAQLEAAIAKSEKDGVNILKDVCTVHEARSIYLGLDLEKFLNWVEEIRIANDLSKILFIWDEFTSFFENNNYNIVTFRGLAEANALKKGLLFVPITHMHISALTDSDGAARSRDAYEFCELLINENIVFDLAASTIISKSGKKAEWENEKNHLGAQIKNLVDSYMAPHLKNLDVDFSNFKGILPFQPMAALMLKTLAEKTGSVRSFLEYMKPNQGESEFQSFIQNGGTNIPGWQFLTIDHLWHYFVERADLDMPEYIRNVGNRFVVLNRSAQLDTQEERVFKTICLFNIVEEAIGRDGQKLLQSTKENIIRSFEGDGDIVNVEDIIDRLAGSKHCCSIAGDHIIPYRGGIDVDPTPFLPQFRECIATPTAEEIKENKFSGNTPNNLRYIVKGFEGISFKHSDITYKSKFGEEGKGNNVLLVFLFAKTKKEQLELKQRAIASAKQHTGLRIAFITVPSLTFCGDNEKYWQIYCEQLASREVANDIATKNVYETERKKMFDQWKNQVIHPSQHFFITFAPLNSGEEPHSHDDCSWDALKNLLENQLSLWFNCGCDPFSRNFTTAFTGAPQAGWATAGLSGDANASRYIGLIRNFKSQGITWDNDWFEKNPNHTLTKIRDFVENKRKNAREGCSLRKIYIDLQRAPYGLQNYSYSSFVLGFVTREWLTKDLQWEDGTSSGELTASILAEIIDAVVKDNGENRIKGEKKVTKLSTQEKAFQRKMRDLFSLSTQGDTTSTQIISDILSSLSKRSKIPLGILSEYLRKREPIMGDSMASLVEYIVQALSASAKNESARREAIMAIGDMVAKAENEEIVSSLKAYITPQSLHDALMDYVNSKMPALKELAANANDIGLLYCDAVMKRLPDSAGALWKTEDVDRTIEEVFSQYRIQNCVREICDLEVFLSYDQAIGKLQKAIFSDNKISLEIISDKYPFVSSFGSLVKNGLAANDFAALADVITVERENVKSLFFNPAHSLQFDFLRQIAKNVNEEVTDAELSSVYHNLAILSDHSADEERTAVVETLRKVRAKSMVTKLGALWEAKSKSYSPSLWACEHNLPTELLFDDAALGIDLCAVIASPGGFSDKKVKDACEVLADLNLENDSAILEKRFLKRFLPKKYSSLGIDASMLAKAFAASLGEDPNGWRNSEEREAVVDSFVRKEYSSHLKSSIIAKVQGKSDADAKRLLIKMLEEMPELGIKLSQGGI